MHAMLAIRPVYGNQYNVIIILIIQEHVVGAQLCRLSPVDAHAVALKPVMVNN